MKPPSIVIDHFLSTKWSKKLFTINHYELQNGKCIVTQELSAYGTQAILSYNYGARCVNRVKDAERNILGVMLIFTTIMFLLSRFIPRYFVLLFTTDPQYIRFSVWVIRTYTLMIIPLSFQYVFVDGLTALECPKTGLALSVTRKSLFVISAAVLPSFFGAKAAFFAEPVADGISSVLSTIVFLLLINRHLDKRCRMDKKESL